jgi:transcription factor STE12
LAQYVLLFIPSIYPANKAFRHKRTHGREDGGDGSLHLSGDEEEDFSGDDHLGSLEEASPHSDSAYVTGSLNAVAHGSTPPSSNAPTQAFSSLETLSMPMTMSQPAAINASGMM